MILSSFAFHTALLVTTFVSTPHATAANIIKSLTKSSSSSMVPIEGLVKTQQQRQSKDFHDLLLRSTKQETENTAEYETKASLLSTALQILSNSFHNAFAALTAAWKRASDHLFMTAASHQDKPTRITNSTWFAVFHDLTSTHGASHQVRVLLTQILQPPPLPPSERFTLENTNNYVKTFSNFLFGIFVDPRYIHYGNIAVIDPCELTGYHLGFPYGLLSQRFYQSAHVPVCLPKNVDTCTTIYKSPMKYIMDYATEHYTYRQKENYPTTITRAEMNNALNNWLRDELETFQNWLHDRTTVVDHWWSEKSDSTIEWIVSVTKNIKDYWWESILQALQFVQKDIVANLRKFQAWTVTVIRQEWNQIVAALQSMMTQSVYLKVLEVQWETVSATVVGFVHDVAMGIDNRIFGEQDGFKKWLEDQSTMLKNWWSSTGMKDFSNYEIPLVTITTFAWVSLFIVVLIGLAIYKNHHRRRKHSLSNRKLRKKLRKKIKRALKLAAVAAATKSAPGVTATSTPSTTPPAGISP